MPRLPAVVTAVIVGLGLLSAPAATGATEPVETRGISWSACRDAELASYGLQCGALEVPLDHASPEGTKIKLALTRRPHTSSLASYQGVILTNPGGPGASGRSLASLGDYVPGGAGDSYDWIGFDPRGVGASTPSLRCSRTYFGVNRPSYVPTRARHYSYWLSKNRAYANACADTAAERSLLAHMSTSDSVHDMEAIRLALGVEKLNYYGFSYGTYLGQLYATRHPGRVGRFVLDGVVDAGRVWYAANLDQNRAFDRNMNVFWRYLARRPGHFRLGTTAGAVRRTYYRTLRSLDRRPAAAGRLGPSELADVMLEAGYYVYDWPGLGEDFSRLVRRRQGGALFARYRESQMGDDNSFAVYNAVQCTDQVWPGWARTKRDAQRLHRVAPFLTWGNTWFNAPCLYWRAPGKRPAAVTGRAVTAKMLLISETLDAATPYAGARRTRARFPSASLVAGIGGTTHSSSFSGVACVDNAVAAYLRTGRVPARVAGAGPDRRCPKVQPPLSAGLGARTTGAVDRLPAALRRDLVAAQQSGH